MRAPIDRAALFLIATVLLSGASAFGSPSIALSARARALAVAAARRRKDHGTRPQRNLRATPLDWASKVTEHGWDTPQYAKRFERMFKVTYAEFGELTQRITARRAEQEARDRRGADGWWSRVTRALCGGVTPLKLPVRSEDSREVDWYPNYACGDGAPALHVLARTVAPRETPRHRRETRIRTVWLRFPRDMGRQHTGCGKGGGWRE